VDRYRIEEKPGLYVALHVYECPPSLLERSVELASGVVTVENLRPTRARRSGSTSRFNCTRTT
jgi:hypothetical protein